MNARYSSIAKVPKAPLPFFAIDVVRINQRLVKLLVNQNADLQMLDAKGRTALGRATERNLRGKPDANIEVIEWLRTKTYEQSVDRYFRTHYDHHFDEKGLLNIRKR